VRPGSRALSSALSVRIEVARHAVEEMKPARGRSVVLEPGNKATVATTTSPCAQKQSYYHHHTHGWDPPRTAQGRSTALETETRCSSREQPHHAPREKRGGGRRGER
jgi:hypothetical protein